jgi:hypothetical protein
MQLQTILDWFRNHDDLLLWATGASIIFYAAILLTMPLIAARMPLDYFKPEYQSPFRHDHPVIGGLIWLARNIAGGLLLVAGFAMVPLPGPGVPVVLMGLMITTLPARRHLMRMALRRRPVLNAFNWFRAKRGAPPFQLSDIARRSRRRFFLRPRRSLPEEAATTPATDSGTPAEKGSDSGSPSRPA